MTTSMARAVSVFLRRPGREIGLKTVWRHTDVGLVDRRVDGFLLAPSPVMILTARERPGAR